MMPFLFSLIVLFSTSCFDQTPTIDVRVVDGVQTYTVDITTSACGSLYSSFNGVEGWHIVTYTDPQTRTLRIPGSGAIDINYAPTKGRRYCFVNNVGVVCSQPLDSWKPFKLFLPILAR